MAAAPIRTAGLARRATGGVAGIAVAVVRPVRRALDLVAAVAGGRALGRVARTGGAVEVAFASGGADYGVARTRAGARDRALRVGLARDVGACVRAGTVDRAVPAGRARHVVAAVGTRALGGARLLDLVALGAVAW